MTLATIAVAFFLSPGSGAEPVELSGADMRADWTNHAMTAEVCVTPRMPSFNILASWHKLGVKVLKKVAYDPEESAEHFRRNVGALALHEGADGVWLVGKEAFPANWKASLAEAEKDVEAMLYAKELAEKAMGMRLTDPNAWIAGRHVLWQFEFMDFETENLDTIRLEFLCYARYLEQLMKLPKRDLPFVASKPPDGPDRMRFVPFKGEKVEAKSVSVAAKDTLELAPGLSFFRDRWNFGFVVESKKTAGDAPPEGGFTLKLYLPGKDGTYLPYEWRFDLTPTPAGRAPAESYGLWFGVERWGRGSFDSVPGRLVSVYRGSRSPDYPHLRPEHRYERPKEGGWRVTLSFGWHQLYGHWPAVVNGQRDRWYVGLSGAKDLPASRVRLNWPAGRAANFKTMTGLLDVYAVSRACANELRQSKGLYRVAHWERLYDWAKVPEPTFHRGDTESDRIFCERVVDPLVEADAGIRRMFEDNPKGDNGEKPHGPKVVDQPDAVKATIWKRVGRLLDLSYRVSILRRDYLLGRAAGQIPPEPPKKKPDAGAAVPTGPDVDSDEGAIDLDEEVL